MPVGDLFKGDTGKGLAIGLGIAILTPLVIAVFSGVGRPVARAAIKSGLVMFEKGKETLAEFGEVMEDLVAEARAEIEQNRAAAVSVATGAQDTAGNTEQTGAAPPGGSRE